LLSLLKIALAVWSLLCFHRVDFSNFVKNNIEILMGIVLNL
jgi:hypothetical protein